MLKKNIRISVDQKKKLKKPIAFIKTDKQYLLTIYKSLMRWRIHTKIPREDSTDLSKQI